MTEGLAMRNRRDWNAKIIQEFRENDGEVDGPYEGMKLLILHTTGAKSGKEHVNPVATIREDGHYIITASKGGAPSNPDWYYNLVANPRVTIEVGSETLKAHAEVTKEPERTALYSEMADQYAGFKKYEHKTDRVIPVIKLTPLDRDTLGGHGDK
jgi:deazaflavin-dependent oxidoreductase (nitroreductase family)